MKHTGVSNGKCVIHVCGHEEEVNVLKLAQNVVKLFQGKRDYHTVKSLCNALE